MNLAKLMPKLPLVLGWIDSALAAHAAQARPLAAYRFPRLPAFYSPRLLAAAKVVEVSRVPVPPLSALGLPEFAPFESGDYTGITYKDTYFVRAAEATRESLHFHELVHVVQWHHLGVDRFLIAYAIGLLQHGYDNSPLEVVARQFQAHFDGGGRPGDVESAVRRHLDAAFVPRLDQILRDGAF